LDTSTRIFILLIVILAAVSAVTTLLPPWIPVEATDLPAPLPVLAAANAAIALFGYGALGYFGLRLGRIVGFAPLWDTADALRSRIFRPVLIGSAIGLFFIPADLAFSALHQAGRLPHPPFPQSLLASIAAGIGEEALFRLFFVSFWFWIVGRILLRGRGRDIVFWCVAAFSAIVFALGHLPALLALLGQAVTIVDMLALPPALRAEVVLLNGVLSLVAAKALRDNGFLAAVGIHFWADVVWHVLWGPLS